MKSFSFLAFLIGSFFLFEATDAAANEPIELSSSAEFYTLIQNNTFDVILDVRDQSDFDAGHIEGAIHIPNLAKTEMPPLPPLLVGDLSSPPGCNREDYQVAVYCYTGGRAGMVIESLIKGGFKAQLYNGLGTQQWLDSGYNLTTNSSSPVPECIFNNTYFAVDGDSSSSASSSQSSLSCVSYLMIFFSFLTVFMSM